MRRLFSIYPLPRGDSELSVVLGLGVATLFAVALGGLFYTPDKTTSQVPVNTTFVDYTDYACCDTGNGEACGLVPGKTITYNGAEYGLIRSSMFFSEAQHVKPTDQRAPSGERIFYIQESGGRDPGMEPRPNEDVLWGGTDDNPNLIPKNTLIYVCRSGEEACSQDTGQAIFDGYWKVGVPIGNDIKYCSRRDTNGRLIPDPTFPVQNSGQVIVTPGQDSSKSSLQIGTFSVVQQAHTAYIADWLTPYCKPALYLYPPDKMNVHVQLAPQGELSVTIPQYPLTGWNVQAFPNGDVFSDKTRYDYLYYEAKLPDSKINPPKDGYVVSYETLESSLSNLLTELGLNEKEKTQFVEYWVKVLPHSPYYFIGIMPESELDTLSPLFIKPTPDNVRRVTLYFDTLDSWKEVKAPKMFPPFDRSGFSVVEWGGILKQHADKPFSCLM